MKRSFALVTVLSLVLAGCSLFDLNPSGKDDTDDPKTTDKGIQGKISSPQKWDDPDVYKITGSVSIEADVVWKKGIEVSVSDGAVIEISNGGSLTIEEDVLVKLGSGSYIKVASSGSGTLIAVGSDSLPITFTKATGTGKWGYGNNASYSGGIWFGKNITSDCKLDNCVIEYATTGIYVEDSPIEIVNCKISNNLYYGINFNGKNAEPADSASFINNSITKNGNYPIRMHCNAVRNLPGDTYLKDNSKPEICIVGGDITEDAYWKKQMTPYFIEGAIHVQGAGGVTLRIEPGTVCQFDDDAYLGIGESNPGTLIAVGTDSLPITFTKTPSGEKWGYGSRADYSGGIWLGASITNKTKLEYCIIEHATTGIFVEDDRVVVKNCVISDNQYHGIYFSGSESGPKDSASFAGNSITNNGSYGLSMYANAVGNLSGDTYFSDNGKEGILVFGDNLTDDAVWKRHTVPYIIDGRVSVGNDAGVKLTINPGVTLLFDEDAYLHVGDGGELKANGTEEDSIIFASVTDGAKWGYGSRADYSGGIWIGPNATRNCSIRYCVIDNATTGIIVENGAVVTVRNTSITNSQFNGVYFESGSPKDSTCFTDNTISGSGEYPICVSARYLTDLGRGTYTDNKKDAIYVIGTQVENSGNWKELGVPYIVDGTIYVGNSDGVEIKIEPGTIFKFTVNSYIEIRENAILSAKGTASDSIVFTYQTSGAAWGYGNREDYAGGIWVNNSSSTSTTFKYCRVEGSKNGMYIHEQITVENCLFKDNLYYGVYLGEKGAGVDLETCEFDGNGKGDYFSE